MSHLCKASNGHLLKRSSGHLANGCPSGCSTCNTTYTLIVSGIGACSCVGDNTGSFTPVRWYTASAAPTGTFTLTRTTSTTWETGLTGVTITQYSDSACTTTVQTVNTFWRLTCSGTGSSKSWTLTLITSAALTDAMVTYTAGNFGSCAGVSMNSSTIAGFCGRGSIFRGVGSDSASFS